MKNIANIMIGIMAVNIIVFMLSLLMGDAAPMWFRVLHVAVALPSFVFCLYAYWKKW